MTIWNQRKAQSQESLTGNSNCKSKSTLNQWRVEKADLKASRRLAGNWLESLAVDRNWRRSRRRQAPPPPLPGSSVNVLLARPGSLSYTGQKVRDARELAADRKERKKGKSAHRTRLQYQRERKGKKKKQPTPSGIPSAKHYFGYGIIQADKTRPQRCHYQRSSWSNLLDKETSSVRPIFFFFFPAASRRLSGKFKQSRRRLLSHIFLPLCVPGPDGKIYFQFQILASLSSLGRRIFRAKNFCFMRYITKQWRSFGK